MKEQGTETQQLFRLGYQADFTFLKMNKVSLSFQEKILIIFVSGSKIRVFKEKLEIPLHPTRPKLHEYFTLHDKRDLQIQ